MRRKLPLAASAAASSVPLATGFAAAVRCREEAPEYVQHIHSSNGGVHESAGQREAPRDRRRSYLAWLLINRREGKAPFHHLANDLVPRPARSSPPPGPRGGFCSRAEVISAGRGSTSDSLDCSTFIATIFYTKFILQRLIYVCL